MTVKMSVKSGFALALLLTMSAAALAHSFTQGDITVSHPWSSATPGGAAVGVGYVKITNNGIAADRLKGGTFDGAAAVEVHEMIIEGDAMKMRRLNDGPEIKPHSTVELKPGGMHLMFTDLKSKIEAGVSRKGSLMFEKAGSIGVEFKIELVGATESHDHKN